MFYASKFLWTVLNPFNIIVIVLILSLIFRILHYNLISKFFILTSFILFIIMGALPTGSYLNHVLEREFHSSFDIPAKLDGILILSGATNPYLTEEYNQINLNQGAERLIQFLIIAKKRPHAKVIFSGGPANICCKYLKDSSAAKKFFTDMDYDIKKIIFEENARNTYENILFSKKIAQPSFDENWLVISSAFHLRRVMNVSKKLNWNLYPYATDFNDTKLFSFNLSFDILGNLNDFQKASHEWLGLFYYFISRKSDSI